MDKELLAYLYSVLKGYNEREKLMRDRPDFDRRYTQQANSMTEVQYPSLKEQFARSKAEAEWAIQNAPQTEKRNAAFLRMFSIPTNEQFGYTNEQGELLPWAKWLGIIPSSINKQDLGELQGGRYKGV